MYYYKLFVALLFCCLSYTSTSATATPRQKEYSVCGEVIGFNRIKIVALFNASLGNWPWNVALGYLRNNDPTIFWDCEGSLISDKWILTSGHCIYNTEGRKLTTARLGDLHLDDNVNDGASPIDIDVEEAIPHPQLVLSPLTNDIALLRLKNPVNFTANIRPVCVLNNTELHKSDNFYNNTLPFAAGWPYTYNGENRINSKMLQDKHLAIVDRKICSDKYSRLTMSPIDNRTLCAINWNCCDCESDSGGPLLLPAGNSFYVAGIFSFGDRCTSRNNMDHPRVFTKVAYYSDWIRNVTGIKF